MPCMVACGAAEIVDGNGRDAGAVLQSNQLQLKGGRSRLVPCVMLSLLYALITIIYEDVIRLRNIELRKQTCI